LREWTSAKRGRRLIKKNNREWSLMLYNILNRFLVKFLVHFLGPGRKWRAFRNADGFEGIAIPLRIDFPDI
jgi:hypothetical protein